MGKDYIGFSNWKLSLRGTNSKWCSLSLGSINPLSWTNQQIMKTNCEKLYLLHLLHLLQIYNKQHLHKTDHTHNAKSGENTHQNKEINMDWSSSWRNHGVCWSKDPLLTKSKQIVGGYHRLPYLIIWMVKQGIKNGTNKCVNRGRRQSHSWMDIS